MIRRRRTPVERAQMLAEYQQSGLTQKAFAAQANISSVTLSAWLRQAAARSDSSPPQFLALPNLLSTSRSAAAYRLHWPDGVTLEVNAGFAAAELSALLQALRRL